ncbi:MAG: peroxiredoxin-like family protein [Arenimonas sp.]|jgi:peroxiredoxin
MTLSTELKAMTESVRQQVPAEVMATLEAGAATLRASGVARNVIKPGDRMPEFELPDANGVTVRSRDLLVKGPLLLTFYRGSWCPYCNLELNALQQRLPDIRARGASLVAISPQTPDASLTTQMKHDLKFPVLSDAGNKIARKFGLVFTLDDGLKKIYDAFGIDLLAHNGDGSLELPVPATYLIGSDGVVLASYVNLDYRERLEPEVAIGWLDGKGR